jgi:signal transduction histidine kinase
VAEVRITDRGGENGNPDLARAFEPLYSTKPGGTGLGLPIAQRIAEAHGGDIRLERGDEETSAVVRLPLR